MRKRKYSIGIITTLLLTIIALSSVQAIEVNEVVSEKLSDRVLFTYIHGEGCSERQYKLGLLTDFEFDGRITIKEYHTTYPFKVEYKVSHVSIPRIFGTVWWIAEGTYMTWGITTQDISYY